jgi:hypothetical protein
MDSAKRFPYQRKAGEKKKPKIKDKRQSERFKEAAREICAD